MRHRFTAPSAHAQQLMDPRFDDRQGLIAPEGPVGLRVFIVRNKGEIRAIQLRAVFLPAQPSPGIRLKQHLLTSILWHASCRGETQKRAHARLYS
jgi:hypothetical protein